MDKNLKNKTGKKNKGKGESKKDRSAFFLSLKRVASHCLTKKRFIATGGLALFVLYLAALGYYSMTPIDRRNLTVVVDIPTGTSFIQATEILNRAGLVKSRLLFYGLTVVKNARRQIRAGEYEINTMLSPSQMVDKLIHGEIKMYKVTIPEDLTMR